MSIKSIQSGMTSLGSDLFDSRKQQMDAFRSLGQALKTGNVSGATTALQTLKDAQVKADPLPGTSSSTQPNNPFAAIEAALKSGDTTAAANAFAALQNQMHAHHGRPHGNHAPDRPQMGGENDGAQSGLAGSTLSISA